MGNESERCLAVLIDADNARCDDLAAILAEISKYGVPTVRRAYGDWTKQSLAGWKEVLLQNGVVPVQQYAYTIGKNATDAAMIIDAMDFLHGGRVDDFVLVSSDSDFTPLVLRLRESGVKVYGIGEIKTPKPFITACDKFVYADILRPMSSVQKPQKAVHDKKPSSKTTKEPVDVVQKEKVPSVETIIVPDTLRSIMRLQTI